MDITPHEINWIEGPNNLPSGTKMAVLEGDPSKFGPFTIRIKMPAQYKIPAHWHPVIEHVTVLQGNFYMGYGDKFDETKGKQLPIGSFSVIPEKIHHFIWSGDEEVIVQLHGIGPWGITYINPDDDPRKTEKE
ncbi:MAG: cupin domain-containing protein [Proteobacteria bacterium]|nr:cupin domain-containing protein [Pseudomonadota bacterium]